MLILRSTLFPVFRSITAGDSLLAIRGSCDAGLVVARMRADVLVGPSPWVKERFGAQAAGELWTRIPEALNTAIARAVHSRPHEQQATDRLLVSPRWPLPYEELVVYLGDLPG